MTIEEDLGELCAAYRREIELGTFLFTPFERSVIFLSALKKSFIAKEVEREDLISMVNRLQKSVIEFEQALQGREMGDPEKQELQVKQHKKLTFALLGHQIKEICSLLDQTKKPPLSSQPSSSPKKPKARSPFPKKGWMRT